MADPPGSATPSIVTDPNANPLTKIRQGTRQGGTLVTDGSDTGWVHHSAVDQYLDENPGWERASVFSDSTGPVSAVRSSEAAKYQRENPQLTPFAPAQRALPPLPMFTQGQRLNVGPAPPRPRSVAEGLETEREEQRAGMPLQMQPGGAIAPVPLQTQPLALPANANVEPTELHQQDWSNLGDYFRSNQSLADVNAQDAAWRARMNQQWQARRMAPDQPLPPLRARDYVAGAINALTAAEPGAETGLPEIGTQGVQAASDLATPGQRWRGTGEMLGAGGEALSPFLGIAALEHPGSVMRLGLEGYAAGKGARAIAARAGATPEQQDVAEQLGQVLVPAAGEAAFQPRFGAGINPREVVLRGGVRVPFAGDVAAEARIPRFGGAAEAAQPAAARPAGALQEPLEPLSAWDAARGGLRATPAETPQTLTSALEPSRTGALTPPQATLRAGPLGPVFSEPALFSRPLTGPPTTTAQLDLPGMNLPRTAEPFYSKAEQIADAKLPKTGTGDAFLATLRNNGVKAEEIADLKLDDFAGKQKVTKQDFLDAIRSRRPELEQTTLHEGKEPGSLYENYATPGGENYRETLTQYPASEASKRAQALQEEIDQRKADLDDEIDRHNAASAEEQAQWPEGYFDKERAAINGLYDQLHAAQREARTADYQSSHWTEHPNVLMHSRESDFTTTDGMPVRHVHEWQSDLHQKGRESGYQVPTIRTLPEGFHTARNPKGYYYIVDREGKPTGVPSAPTQEAAIDSFIGRYNENVANPRGAPNAPFKKSWHELAVKDSIRRAINDGKQGMTWDTGETQADRYDLAKQVERIEYDPHTETLTGWDHSGRRVVEENAKPEELANYVGREGAQKLQQQIENYSPPSDESDYEIRYDPETETYTVHDPSGEMIGEEETNRDAERMIRDYVEHERENAELPTLRGDDLQVGGHGMKGFYDKIIPDYVSKYAKKWGGKVDTAEIPTGVTRTEREYVGPDRTEDEVRKMWEKAAHAGPLEWKQRPGGSWAWFDKDGAQVSGGFHDESARETARMTISRNAFESDLREVLNQVRRGVPFKEAMSGQGSAMAELFGGEMGTREVPETTTVHRLTFTPQMIDAIKGEGQPLYRRPTETAGAEPDLEAARRGAAGQTPSPNAVEQATNKVNSLRAQVDNAQTAGERSHLVSQLRNAEDELEAARSGSALAARGPGVPVHQLAEYVAGLSQREREDLATTAARYMSTIVDPGGPKKAATLRIGDAARLFLEAMGYTRGQGNWLGLNMGHLDAMNIATHMEQAANVAEAQGAHPAIVQNIRDLSNNMQRILQLNSEPGAGHAGLPIEWKGDEKTALHERRHGGQRAFSPTGSITDFTDIDADHAHPSMQLMQPTMERLGLAGNKAAQVAEAHNYIMDGDREKLGLSKEQAVSYMIHALRVLEAKQGPERMANPPRLSTELLEDWRNFIRQHGGNPDEGRAAQIAHAGGAGGNAPENAGTAQVPGRPAAGGSAASTAGGGGGQEEVTPPEQSSLFRRPTRAEADEAKLISPRNPTAVPDSREFDPLKESRPVNTQAVLDLPRNKYGELGKQVIARLLKQYPGLAKLRGMNPDDAIRAFQRQAESNVLWMYDNYPEEFRNMSKLWYDGANNVVAKQWPREYGTTDMQAMGGIAAMSPKLEWNKNVSLEKRVIEAMKQQEELRYTSKMVTRAREMLNETEPQKRPGLQAALKQIAGRRLADLQTPMQKALWIKLHDEAEGDPSYDIYMPDGTTVGKARNDDGSLSKIQWATTPNIAKAVSIFEDPSRENIHKQLGEAHKIRIFYNTGVAPNAPQRNVVVDTHAVATDQVRPLSMKSTEVLHNFGAGAKGEEYAPGSSVTGVQGTYGIHSDAYANAADKRDIKPREMQSTTWDNGRSVFPRRFKTSTNQDIINQLWREHDRGKPINETRRDIIDAAGGWKPPDWAKYIGRRSRSSGAAPTGPTSNPRQLLGAGAGGQQRGGSLAGRGSTAAEGTPELGQVPKVKSSPAIPPQLKRVIRR